MASASEEKTGRSGQPTHRPGGRGGNWMSLPLAAITGARAGAGAATGFVGMPSATGLAKAAGWCFSTKPRMPERSAATV